MNQGTQKVKRIIYGRTLIMVLLVLIQIAVLVGGYIFMRHQAVWLYGSLTALSILLVIYLVNRAINPMYKITWIVLILVFPVFGAFWYFFTHLDIGTHAIHRAYRRRAEETQCYLTQRTEPLKALEEQDPGAASTARYLADLGYPLYRNGKAQYFPLGEDKFQAMLTQLKEAKQFIFMEYFIIAKGIMWDSILEILESKVKEGVDVRLIYDGMGTLTTLPYNYLEELQKKGIQCKVFSPIKPALSSYQNNRDHRKILVVDGKVAFTGGVNLADEYINEKERFGHWKDTAVMIEGDAVRNFTLMFLQMWGLSQKAPVNYKDFLRPLQTEEDAAAEENEEGFVIPFGDTPLDEENTGEQVYFDIIHQATRYVHIMTPYLILDNEMITALTHAARRGVEVQVILPHIPDKPAAFWLAKSHYEELIQSGVDIFEYTPGFVHAKTFVADDCKGTVGTINLDYRSLYLHFECGAYFYGCPMLKDMEKDFQAMQQQCHKVTLEEAHKRPLKQKLLGCLLRIIAPLM